MRRVGAGDPDAFAALYDRWGRRVMSFLAHLSGDVSTAEDWTQEVFVKVWKAAPRYDPPTPEAKFSTWLFQVAKHHAWNAAPRARRERAVPAVPAPDAADAPTTAAPAADADRAAASAELSAAIRDALADLSDTLRATFVLVRLEGLSYADAAQVLEVPEGTVKSRMAAAEKALRPRLSRWL
jgi:RNA polymerase sigma-70 factor (ECF subfamily)